MCEHFQVDYDVVESLPKVNSHFYESQSVSFLKASVIYT